MALSTEFLRALPKTDLHVHLDGSLRLPTLIELAKAQGIPLPSETESGLRELVFKDHYANLVEYLQGFGLTVAVMQDSESLERVAFEFAEDNLAEGVRYFEVRFAPQLHAREGMDERQVVEAVARGLEKAANEFNRSAAVTSGQDIPCHYGIILCALRWFSKEMSDYYGRLFSVMPHAQDKQVFAAASLECARVAVALRDSAGIPVVGFDLAGAEHGNPPDDHMEAFLYAHRHFLKKTVHAGEAYGAESIFQALTACHANRIGHGTTLFRDDLVSHPSITDRSRYIDQLVTYIASQRITIEVNLTSNLQTLPEFSTAADHPVGRMLDHRLSATVCTDNRLVSNTSVTEELDLVVTHFDVDMPRLKALILAGFKGAFFPGTYREKRTYVRNAINRFDAVVREHGVG